MRALETACGGLDDGAGRRARDDIRHAAALEAQDSAERGGELLGLGPGDRDRRQLGTPERVLGFRPGLHAFLYDADPAQPAPVRDDGAIALTEQRDRRAA